MSRVGQVPISIPSGVTVEVTGKQVAVKGPKGELTANILSGIKVDQTDDTITVDVTKDTPQHHARQGLNRTLLANAVTGVSEGFSKKLEVNGVGYKAQVSGKQITLNLGYSHPLEYTLPDGIEAAVEENIITISGIDKQLVGQVAAHIRGFRKPEPYKGKGIRYVDEYVRRKAGKTATATAGGA